MKFKIILFSSLLLASVLVLLTASYTFGCVPDEGYPFRCADTPPKPTPDPVVVHVAAVTTPGFGTSPDNAVEPTGAWQLIGPNQTHWYKMDDAGMELNIWIDANGQGRNGLAMAIFAPEQKDLYGKPIGRGSFNPSIPSHDLYWDGFTIASGIWYAQVSNRTNTPISYNMNYQKVINSTAAGCSLCHGYNISDWGRCQDKGGNFCAGLKGSDKR